MMMMIENENIKFYINTTRRYTTKNNNYYCIQRSTSLSSTTANAIGMFKYSTSATVYVVLYCR